MVRTPARSSYVVETTVQCSSDVVLIIVAKKYAEPKAVFRIFAALRHVLWTHAQSLYVEAMRVGWMVALLKSAHSPGVVVIYAELMPALLTAVLPPPAKLMHVQLQPVAPMLATKMRALPPVVRLMRVALQCAAQMRA